jgi:hypothetical protein
MRAPKKLTQILPTVRYMNRLNVEEALAAQLIEIVEAALAKNGKLHLEFDQAGKDIFPAVFAPGKAQAAADFYVSAKQTETSLPDFRKMLDRGRRGSVAFAVDQLLKHIETDNHPPFAHMRALYCDEDPGVDGLAEATEDGGDDPEAPETDDPEYDDDSNEPEGIWRSKYSAEAMKDALSEWLRLMEELHKRAGGGLSAPGPSPKDAEIAFVGWLVSYWHGELGLPLVSGRGKPADDNTHDQQGAFADFVRKAAEIIPEGLRPHSWDHAIRKNLPEET